MIFLEMLFKIFVYLFIFGCIESVAARRLLLVVVSWGLLFIVVSGLLIAVASLIAEDKL